ncbi:mTERF domain-containing protein 1 [Tropilaelaps mercedesae]|uniref:mTERF domain-containing protein 1 n=1 Tax=Tropilaelaps mercedesae TaxID=418985 RepID=A0A1V9Y1L7_9ACAR|nr:mTERF domain-containing protein 1 [Tropilaelaps mercedesae]
MTLISVLLRRTVAQRSAFPFIYPVRAIRSQGSTDANKTITGETNVDATRAYWRKSKTKRILVGQIVKEKFEKFPQKSSHRVAAPPTVIDLIRLEPSKDPVPKQEYTEEEQAIFSGVEEIAKEDALKDYRENQFDAKFLDTIGPGIRPVYNIAALANKAEVLQKLIHLGVSMYQWDRKPEIIQKIIALNWRKDCEPRIDLLFNRAGVHPEDLSMVLSKNPLLLCEDVDFLNTRLDWLCAKMSNKPGEGGWEMTIQEVSRVVTKAPFWLSHSLERLENRVQFFTKEFKLSNQELKQVMIRCPQVMISDLRRLIVNKFSMLEEFGFSFTEMRQVLQTCPKLFIKNKEHLLCRFDVLHRDMGFEHDIIAAFPSVLYCREQRLKDRLGFLQHLHRAQFNPKLPGYVSPLDIAATSDERFLNSVAKSTTEEFETYLKLH